MWGKWRWPILQGCCKDYRGRMWVKCFERLSVLCKCIVSLIAFSRPPQLKKISVARKATCAPGKLTLSGSVWLTARHAALMMFVKLPTLENPCVRQEVCVCSQCAAFLILTSALAYAWFFLVLLLHPKCNSFYCQHLWLVTHDFYISWCAKRLLAKLVTLKM